MLNIMNKNIVSRYLNLGAGWIIKETYGKVMLMSQNERSQYIP